MEDKIKEVFNEIKWLLIATILLVDMMKDGITESVMLMKLYMKSWKAL